MANEKAQNLQDTFLNHVRKSKTSVTIFLVNGVKLQGFVTWFDNFCVLLRRDGHSQLVYKHAISTIMPASPIQMLEAAEEGAATTIERELSEYRHRGPDVGAREQAVAAHTRTLVVCPILTSRGRAAKANLRARPKRGARRRSGLRARSISTSSDRVLVAARAKSAPRPIIGKGKVAELAERVADEEVNLVVMDCALSPVQQRNLEKEFKAKVIDRTGLILEIFGRRARTAEGALQVELAHLDYQKSRLVRSWTHLERQRGGFGFLGGPGETQIETDRRLIQERMIRIERDLEHVKKTRALHRASRKRGSRIRSSRWSATPTPASRRCSTA